MLGFVLVVAERNRKVIVSNVNANVVAYCRLRCRKNRKENRRQLNRTTTVANVTEALIAYIKNISVFQKDFKILRIRPFITYHTGK